MTSKVPAISLSILVATVANMALVNGYVFPVSPNRLSSTSRCRVVGNSPLKATPNSVGVHSSPIIEPNPTLENRRLLKEPIDLESAIASEYPRTRRRRKSRAELTTTFEENRSFPKLLTREEEYEATYKLRALRSAVRIRDELVASKSLDGSDAWQPTEEEWAEACDKSVIELRRTMQEGQNARAILVSANGGLVNKVAQKYYHALKRGSRGYGTVGTILTYQDLVQEGNLGLMEAAERFDPERGFRFSTYATWWVRQRILRSISDYSRIIRLPANVHWKIQKIGRARREIEQEIGRPPTKEELAKYLDISVEKLELYSDSSRSVLSLEVPLRPGNYKGSDDTRTLGDFIKSGTPSPDEVAEIEFLRQDIRDVVNELDVRERDVLVARFGLDDGSPRSVKQTSEYLGISGDRVRIIEARALNKLRNPQRNYKLKNYVATLIEEETEEANMSPEMIWSL